MDFVAAGIVLGFSIYEYYKDKIHDNTQTKILSLPRNKKDVAISVSYTHLTLPTKA